MLYIEENSELTIPSGMSLIIAEGAEMYVYGTLNIEGTATNSGMYIRELGGEISGSVTDQGAGTHYNAYSAETLTEWNARRWPTTAAVILKSRGI
jgi:hypothetical protein